MKKRPVKIPPQGRKGERKTSPLAAALKDLGPKWRRAIRFVITHPPNDQPAVHNSHD